MGLSLRDPQMTIARFTEHALTQALDGIDHGDVPPPPTGEPTGPRAGRRIQRDQS